ncbi:MAG: glycosyltransferase [Woeseiaceae bacterium]
MKIGQIFLDVSASSSDERFIELVAALAEQGVEQHVLVAGARLARRLADIPKVCVGPVVRTPVMAYCLMPDVDLAHVHEIRSGQAGLLLTLTRSIPFVITASRDQARQRNPISRSVFRRAARTIASNGSAPAAALAEKHRRIYAETVTAWRRGLR